MFLYIIYALYLNIYLKERKTPTEHDIKVRYTRKNADI